LSEPRKSVKQQEILIHGRRLRYRVRRNARSRRFRVNVNRTEGVVVVIPTRFALAGVQPQLLEWSDWLAEKVEAIGCWDGPVTKHYASGSRLLVLGRPRFLEIGPLPEGRVRPRITLEDDILRLDLKPEDIWDPRPVLDRWLRRLAEKELAARVEHWSTITGLHPAKLSFRDTHRQWGSCNRLGHISLCYRLVMAPQWVADEVVIHELCHLRYMSHGPRFKALLARHCPDHEAARQWLRGHHEDLLL
jgi:predicted metal-dependent hydrolase